MVMEATGSYSVELTGWINEQCPALAPAIANPRQTSAYLDSMQLRNKTDRVEARALAFYGAERRPAPYETLSPERLELRALSRHRDALVNEKVREQNRGEEPFVSKLLASLHKSRLAQLKRDIAKLEARIKDLIEKTPELSRRLRHVHGCARRARGPPPIQQGAPSDGVRRPHAPRKAIRNQRKCPSDLVQARQSPNSPSVVHGRHGRHTLPWTAQRFL
jgi:transposase